MVHRANRLGLFNGNVLVAEQGRVIYKTAIGFADASGNTRLTTAYRFQIGSIAKEFNAVGIMMLVDQGKLNLDDKVSKYMPMLPQWANKISIKNLLQYTSGLPEIKWNSVKNDADALANLENLEKLDYEPGTSYRYNNSNVFLQRRIIEKITGLPFKNFVEQKILKPLGMNASIIDPNEKDALIANGFNDDKKQDELYYPISGWTAVTLDDFFKWAKSIENFKLITAVSTRKILYPAGPNEQAGLGGGSMDGNKVINHVHDGSVLNYQALEVTDALHGRTIIIMSNNKQGNVYNLNTAIQNILDGKPYDHPKKSILKQYHSTIDTISGNRFLKFYTELKMKDTKVYAFENPSTLNEIGYYLLGNNREADAIIVFEYNTKLFPKSGNVFDSLGEAYYKGGNKEKALVNYKKSFELDPTNINDRKVILELGK